MNTKIKDAFKPEAKFGAFYTGGNVEWHGNYLFCQNATHVSKVDIATGIVALEIGKSVADEVDYDPIIMFASDGNNVITAHKSGLLKFWNISGELKNQWKCIHKGPVVSLHLEEQCLLSGGSDGIVRMWDMKHHICTKALKGCSGVINVLAKHSNLVFASGDDGVIVSWQNGKVKESYSGHFSKVTSIAFTNDSKQFVSCGRDKVLILWKLNHSHALKTVPVYQTIEGILVLPINTLIPGSKETIQEEDAVIMCAGEDGCASIWNIKSCKQLYKQDNSLISRAFVEGSLAVTHLLRNTDFSKVALISAEHNIIIHDSTSFDVLKQFIGFSDEILDVVYCGNNFSHIAVSTNSSDIKLYNNVTMNCQLLKGHTDIVLALSVAPYDSELLASCGKDKTIRLWQIGGGLLQCIAVGVRHTANVTSLSFFHVQKNLVTVSQDNCVKLWQLPEKQKKKTDNIAQDMIATHTEIAHSKDINSVSTSPNDKLIATCSQDKTIKLFTENLNLLGVLKGHRRGVWCCRFSPVDQILASSSADGTIKLWSVGELSCLKTFEAHDTSVLRVEFISEGMQLVSCGAEGLVKLFDIKSSECQLTLDEHEGRIWSLCVSKDESRFITGGSDSQLVKWKDISQEKKLEKQQLREKEVLQEQQLANYLEQEQIYKALRLSLKLNKPNTTLKLVNRFIKKGESTELNEAVESLNPYEKETLLSYSTIWNTNSKNCHSAQLVLNILLRKIQAGTFKTTKLASTIEANLGYTERHYRRLAGWMKDLKFIDYTVSSMEPYS